MRKTLLLPLLICLINIAQAQNTGTTYYRDKDLYEEVPRSRAKFSKSYSTNADGDVITVITDLLNNEVSRSYNSEGEPTGVWKYRIREKVYELNYNFKLMYSSSNCFDSIPGIDNTKILNDNASFDYVAPKISTGVNGINEFLRSEVVYPREAVLTGISGTVLVGININESGGIDEIFVIKGRNKMLDKEAVRALGKIVFTNPAIFNGRPYKFCLKVPVIFTLL